MLSDVLWYNRLAHKPISIFDEANHLCETLTAIGPLSKLNFADWFKLNLNIELEGSNKAYFPSFLIVPEIQNSTPYQTNIMNTE